MRRLLPIVLIVKLVGASVAADPPAPATADKLVVAVYAIEESAGLFDKQACEQLTRFLEEELIKTGRFVLTPRKKDMPKHGKLTPPGYTLSTRVLRIQGVCQVTSVLYNLKKAGTEHAATAEAACSLVGVRETIGKVATKLGKK